MSPWIVLGVGIVASLVLFEFVRDTVEREAELLFEHQAVEAKHVIEARVQSYSNVLYGLRALFASHGQISRTEFHRFVTNLDLETRYPGFEVVNYAIYVRAEEKKRFEAEVRMDTSLEPGGYPQFAIKPPGERSEYHVLVYLEPMAGNEFALGLDLGVNPAVAASDPKTLTALQHRARDSGELTASGRLIRVMRTKEIIGLAMRLAVYRGGMPVETVEQRRAAYLGSVGAGFNVEEIMKGALNDETLRFMRFRLFDVGLANGHVASGLPPGDHLLFDSNQLIRTPPLETGVSDAPSRSVRVLTMEVGGRIWQVHFSAQKEAIIGRASALWPWLFLAGGLLSSVLLFGMFYFLTSSRSRAVAIAHEITRNLRESEKELRASTEQIQAMSRRLVDVQESERRQFSRELHDRVGQNLTALSINLDILKSQLPANGNEAIRTRLNDAAALLESTAGSIENVMSELRPPMLDDYGLLPAVQWYADEFSRRTGIQVTVKGEEGSGRPPQASEIALFRVMQEALNNVAKHAHASRVQIALERSESQFAMSIADDGVGFDTAPLPASRRRQGLGMVTMRERAQAVGGEFEIGVASGGGTRLVVRVPC